MHENVVIFRNVTWSCILNGKLWFWLFQNYIAYFKAQLFSATYAAAIKWCTVGDNLIPQTTSAAHRLLAVAFTILEGVTGCPRSAPDIYNFQHELILPSHVTAMPDWLTFQIKSERSAREYGIIDSGASVISYLSIWYASRYELFISGVANWPGQFVAIR